MGKRIGTLGLVNYRTHPQQKEFMVFNFNTEKEALLFEEMLNEKRISFEKSEEEHEDAILYLYGVHERDFPKAQDANFMVSAKTRRPIIPMAFFRYALVLFFFAIVAFAIIGYIKSQ